MSGHLDLDALPWHELEEHLDGRLVRVESPLQPCVIDGASPACSSALRNLRNPFFNEDEPGAFQTTGWLDAYAAVPSRYAVAAATANDIAATVIFARDHGVRLVVKGTGHDYLGRSSAPDSLLVWTHDMRDVTVQDAFEITGSTGGRGVPAITVGAGTRWLEAYQAATKHGRYVQGGGCTSVGVAGGFTQGGGFGSFSKRFGTAAGSVLEIEVVTADGEILVANEARHPDLFWALRGGGGGTFGVVSRMTLLTHEPPETFGAAIGTITAGSDADYRQLVRELVELYPRLDDEHWGEQIRLAPDNSLQVAMLLLDLTEDEAREVWRPLLERTARRLDSVSADVHFATLPFGALWDAHWWDQNVPDFVSHDDRPGQPPDLFWWTSNQNEVSQHLDAYTSRWLPIAMFDDSEADRLSDALFEASRHWHYTIHANKGLSGAAPEALERDRTTSINQAAFEAAGLVIMASNQPCTYPGVPGHEPDRAAGRVVARRVDAATKIIRATTPGGGAYPNEADYFEPDWQQSFWGNNYPKLLEIKRRYDPTNLFRVHHGVGSDA
jgi:FAD/FMN-containing dehydrogenase